LRRADRRAQDGQARSGGPYPADELRERAEVTVRPGDLIGRHDIATACLEYTEPAQIAAHRGLRHIVSVALEQAHELALPLHDAAPEDALDCRAAVELRMAIQCGRA